MSSDAIVSPPHSIIETLQDSTEILKYLRLLGSGPQLSTAQTGWREELKTAPLFTWPVKSVSSTYLSSNTLRHPDEGCSADPVCQGLTEPTSPFTQYAVLGSELASTQRPDRSEMENAVFLNTNAPWSAFLCGSQGSGKSHTLSCILENCLMSTPDVGKTPKPLSGIVFAYDAHSADFACEAAHMATEIPVRVLVSPSNFRRMKTLYEKLPGDVQVYPLLLKGQHLNTERMMKMMAFSTAEGAVPLYMEVSMSCSVTPKRQTLANACGLRPALGAASRKHSVSPPHLRDAVRVEC